MGVGDADNFSEGEDSFGEIMLIGTLGILGCVWAVAIVGAVSLAVGVGTSKVIYDKNAAQAEKMEEKARVQAQEDKRRAKVMHLKQFNAEIAQYNRGALLAKKELLDAKREEASHGRPVESVSDNNATQNNRRNI